MRDLVHSRTAIAMAIFFGLLSTQGYVIIGWSPQYLRDMGLSAARAGLLLGLNSIVIVPINALVPALTVRPRLQRPLLLTFVGCYLAGWIGLWIAPTAVPWLWMLLLGMGAGAFAMVLTLMGLRARTPETTAAVSSVTQGFGYVVAGAAPIVVGVLRAPAGSYTAMFVLMLVTLAGMIASGWLVTRHCYVDDELPARHERGAELSPSR
jgi:CP family cyanate transporter-like MFS transporter